MDWPGSDTYGCDKINYIYCKTYFEDCGLLEGDLHNFVTFYFHFSSSNEVQVYTFFPGFKDDMQPYTIQQRQPMRAIMLSIVEKNNDSSM